jgi:photosystem II stability/assembly factor-like uncharacterized protein
MMMKCALNFTASIFVISMLLVMLPSAEASRSFETHGRPPNLRGLEGPYRFGKYCSPNEKELWTVGGQGDVLLITKHPTPRRFKLESAGSFRGDLYGVYFNSEGVGWVVGDSGVIFHSPDHGNTWSEQSVGGEDDINAITCADNNTCWAVGENGLLLLTSNGGKVWTRKSLAPKFVDLNAVEFINSKNGWIAGDNNLVLRTNDGGLTWVSYKDPLSCEPKRERCEEPLFSIRFVSDQVGWAASHEQIARTTDGGQTWKVTSIEDDDSVISLVGLVSNDGKNVWAVNEGEHNYFSDDAGCKWRTWR